MAEDLGARIAALQRSGVIQRIVAAHKPTAQMCITCGRETPILEPYTGEARQRMCEQCRRDFHHLAKIMCRGCGKFLGFMQTGIAECGYRVKEDETLHTPFCNNCDKERADREKTGAIEEFEKYAILKRNNDLVGAVQGGKITL